MAARNLKQEEIWLLNMAKASATEAHGEYTRRLNALAALKDLVESKYGGELNMEAGILCSEDSPT